jgi:ATP-dependent RNA helicase RhlE
MAFQALGLSPTLLHSVRSLGFEAPTPIQREAIPVVLGGRDLMGLAQTGTGKTAAFGLPLVQKMAESNIRPAPKSANALILAPTRELVNQIAANLRDFVRNTPLKIASVTGGASINMQIKNMMRGVDILVATPGRLIDLVERRAVFLNTVRFLVLDEADQMLDLGFIHALRKIATLLGTPRQTMLFSATMPRQMEELSRSYLNSPVRVEVAPPGQAADRVRQSVHYIGTTSKAELLKKCLAERPNDLSLVFSRTKHGAEKLMKQLVACGFAAGSIHGNKSQGQRERAIKSFKSGEIRVLVATDVAARGIDIPGVSHVYNFDLPEVPENYVHRIGRTARAGAGGEAVAFCGPDDRHLLREIERLMGIKIAVASGEIPANSGPVGAPANGKSQRGRNSNPRQGRDGGGASGKPQRSQHSRAGESHDHRGDSSAAASAPASAHHRPKAAVNAKPADSRRDNWRRRRPKRSAAA